MIGKQLGHYRIIELLGKGGMGEVYLAQDMNLDRKVALKILPPELAGEEERRLRFQREAKAVATLSHPNIVTIHSVEESGGIHFFTMEFVTGGHLSERTPKDGFSAKDFYRFAIPLVSAVTAAHRNGVTHRDLKPANVMVTEDGQVKVLDFGLAKLTEEQATPPDDQATTLGADGLTELGHALGTAAYMSPEQAEGKVVDERSDIFSLGIILYQMATGAKPFSGDTRISMISAIRKDDPVSISDLKPSLSPRLAELIQHSLEKDPQARLQSADHLLEALTELKRDLDTGELLAGDSGTRIGGRRASTAGPPGLGWRKAALGAACLALIVAVGYLFLDWFGPGDGDRSISTDKRSLAVFYFQNLSGDPQLDWLRAGFTDMLVTDLAQTPTLKVLSTERLHQIMEEQGRAMDTQISFDVVQEVARQTGAGTAVLGSYLKAGEDWLVNLKIQNTTNGEIIDSKRFEGEGDSSILSLVDDLTRSIRDSLELASLQAEQADRELSSVTTESVDAYRHYVEGIRHHETGADEKAIAPLEKALELDPNFAMALAKLSVAHGNTGDKEKEKEYAQKALTLVNRLSDRERYYIEARYYSLDQETQDRAIDAYQKAIERFPDHHSARHNLALIYMEEERYDEVIEHLEVLRREGMVFPATHLFLANAYARKDQHDQAVQVLRDYVERHPDSAAGHRNLGQMLLVVGEPSEAVDSFEKAAQISPSPSVHRLSALALVEEWEEARKLAGQFSAAEHLPFGWVGGVFEALADLYFGRSDQALARLSKLRETITDGESAEQLFQVSAGFAFSVGEADLALEIVEAALAREPGSDVRRGLLALAALSKLSQGDSEGARTYADSFRDAFAQESEAERNRNLHVFEGNFELITGDYEAAISRLLVAEALLPRFPGEGTVLVDVCYGLASAYRAAGDMTEAAGWYQRVVDSKVERLFTPVRFVRSHYFLGKYHEEAGNEAEARRYYQKYVDYWGDGQLDRERILDVKGKLESLPASFPLE